MNIRVNPDTELWLLSQVSSGRFASVEEAVEALVVEHQTAIEDVDRDDHAWAKPQLEEALASLARDGGVPLDDVERELKEIVRKHGS